jgi:hypothetical protein
VFRLVVERVWADDGAPTNTTLLGEGVKMHNKARLSRRVRVAAPLLAVLLASGAYAVSVSGVAGAAANKTVSASGSGNVHCPGDGTVDPAEIHFTAFKFRGGVEGFEGIIEGLDTEKEFHITAGTMNTNSFTLQAVVTFDLCNDEYQDVPVNATISGTCGTDVLVTYSDANGETGTFLSNVACT